MRYDPSKVKLQTLDSIEAIRDTYALDEPRFKPGDRVMWKLQTGEAKRGKVISMFGIMNENGSGGSYWSVICLADGAKAVSQPRREDLLFPEVQYV